MSAFNCQTAPSHKGLEHGFCKVWPSKLHLPMKKSNVIHALFFQKLSLATLNSRELKSFCPRDLQTFKSLPLLSVSCFFVAPLGMVPISSLSSLGVPSCVFLLSCFPQLVSSAFEDSCSTICSHRTSPSSANSLCRACAQTLESKSAFQVATNLGRKSKESGFSFAVFMTNNQTNWFFCPRALVISLPSDVQLVPQQTQGTESKWGHRGYKKQIAQLLRWWKLRADSVWNSITSSNEHQIFVMKSGLGLKAVYFSQNQLQMCETLKLGVLVMPAEQLGGDWRSTHRVHRFQYFAFFPFTQP